MNNRSVNRRDSNCGAARRRGLVASVAVLAMGATMLGASPAHGAGARAAETTPSRAAAAEQLLRAAGVLADAPPGDTTAVATEKAGLAVTSGASTLEVLPVAEPTGALSPSGLPVFDAAGSAIVLSTARTGANAGYVVVGEEAAPTAYEFLLTVDGEPAVLRLGEAGDVAVLDGAGALVNSIAPPWARDANGAEVATSYSVSGNILTQTVEHRGAEYPVVADPRIRCDGLWCTAELSRAETRQVAANTFPPAALCAWFGAIGRVCSTLFLAGWAQANLALLTGQCIGFRVWQRNLVSYPHLTYLPCYA